MNKISSAKKRIAIFAHYDIQNKIDDYVIFYLEQLKKSVDKIIFVSDCDIIDEKELKRLDGLVIERIYKKHGEYDFGSYKRGFKLLTTKYKENFVNLDELVFVNDSCYCLGDFDKTFREMEDVECDAWSLTDDYTNIPGDYKRYHLQSYFLVFRKAVFLEGFFRNFLDGIKKLDCKEKIVFEYEEELSQLLLRNNKKLFAYFSSNKVARSICDSYTTEVRDLIALIKKSSVFKSFDAITFLGDVFDVSRMNYVHSNKFYFLLKLGFPLLKRAIIEDDISIFDSQELTCFWKEMVEEYTSFDVKIIVDHFIRIQRKYKSCSYIFYYRRRRFRRKLLRFLMRTLLQTKVSSDGNIIIKILKIPVFSRSFVKKICRNLIPSRNLS